MAGAFFGLGAGDSWSQFGVERLQTRCSSPTVPHSLLQILIVSFCLVVAGCVEKSARPLESNLPGEPMGSVWKVTSPNGNHLYLCGTIHLLRQEDYPLPGAYDVAYADSQKLILELPPGSSEGGGMVLKMQKLGLLPDGETLEGQVGPELAQSVFKWGEKHGQPAETLARYHPWFVALIIAAVEYGALGAQPDKGVDQFYESKAKQDNKPGVGLESVDFQLGLFAGLNTEQQKDLLEQTLSEVKTISAEFTQMIEAWRAGDLDALSELLFREADDYPHLMEVFLHQRNRHWVPELEAALLSGPTAMVLVGAGHLAGDQGLIALMKGRGFKIERVSASP